MANIKIKEALAMLEAWPCIQDCDGGGIQHSPDPYDVEQCQFCYERGRVVELLRTLGADEGTDGEAETNGAEYEYLVAFLDYANVLRTSSCSICVTTREQSVTQTSNMNRISYSRTPYGAYRRRIDRDVLGDWRLITPPLGMLPAAAESIG